MVLGVVLALLCAQTTSLDAGLEAGAQHLDFRGSLSGENSAGGLTYVGAVEVEADAPGQHLHVLLTQAGIGTGSAGLGAVKADLDALH
jgi:hypothetical protein